MATASAFSSPGEERSSLLHSTSFRDQTSHTNDEDGEGRQQFIRRKPLHVTAISSLESSPLASLQETNVPQQKENGPGSFTPPRDPEHNWVLEILALALSCAAFICVTVLLLLYNGKPLESWHFILSLSTTVSVLGATTRASLAFVLSACIGQGKWNWFQRHEGPLVIFDRFEEATRGPWGSVRLLWWARFRHKVTLGALITVVLIGFEPFLQAIVSYQEVPSENSGLGGASIGVSTLLDAGVFTETGGEDGISSWRLPGTDETLGQWMHSIRPDSGLPAAMSAGLSPSTVPSNLQSTFMCTTGNCTWPMFTSLAICSKCNDISDHIKTRSYMADHPASVIMGDVAFTDHDIPGLDLVLSNMDGDYSRKNWRILECTSRSTSNPGWTLSFRDEDALIYSTAYIKSDRSWAEGTTLWEDTKVEAGECGLYFCANLYDSRVLSGSLNEAIVGSWSNRDPESFQLLHGHLSNVTDAFNAYLNFSLYDAAGTGGFEVRSDLRLTIPSDEVNRLATSSSNITTQFNITQAAIATSIDWLNDYIESRESAKTASSNSVYAVALTESTNITALFDRVAASMTRWVRDMNFHNAPLQGSTITWKIHLQIHWPYFLLPVIALLAACVFTLMTILETRRAGVPAWKGSTLAVLAHSLDKELRQEIRDADDGGQMSRRAREMKVRFKGLNEGRELGAVVEVGRN